MKTSIDQVFEIGKKYTVFRINSMAMTSKQELQIKRSLISIDPTAALGDMVYIEIRYTGDSSI